jgi:predicted dehydrogenase
LYGRFVPQFIRSSLGRPLADELQPLVNNTYLYADELPAERQYDVVFVTNPTSMHYETVEKFAAHTKSFFIEKPVFDSTTVDEKIFETIKEHSFIRCLSVALQCSSAICEAKCES